MDIKDRFERFSDDYLDFKNISPANKLSDRPDLCAFLILDKLVPGKQDIVDSAEHDEFYLSISPETFIELVNDGQLRDLVRCGLRYDSSTESLCFFA